MFDTKYITLLIQMEPIKILLFGYAILGIFKLVKAIIFGSRYYND